MSPFVFSFLIKPFTRTSPSAPAAIDSPTIPSVPADVGSPESLARFTAIVLPCEPDKKTISPLLSVVASAL